MQNNNIIIYEDLLNLAFKLPLTYKKKLISDLQKNLIGKKERTFGKYKGQIWMSEDFNEPLEDFKEYMP